jgi:ABC-type transport system involved in multi-copper enzyme maturation permease subunit
MKTRWGLGPVFAFECIAAARRWLLYAGRVSFVGMLMIGLWGIWAPSEQTFRNLDALAEVAKQFFVAVVSIQFAVVLLVAPAATAGALCVDKSRGVLHHVFVTDLSAREIVLGKLGSRLAALLMLMACGLPVLALSGLLGGIDLVAVLGAYLVTLGVGVLGCALALTFSVWARKPHQALLPTYAVLGIWAGTAPGLILFGGLGPPPTWSPEDWVVMLSNPILCMFAPELDPTQNLLGVQAAFLGVTSLLALGLMNLAAVNVRRVALGQASRPARRERPGGAGRLVALLPGPPLDGNPVLWREWHRKRPTRWTGRLWTLYACVSFLASAWVILEFYVAPSWSDAQFAGLVNGWEVAIGLLLLSISAPLALAEERERGSLDVIMATALPTRTIVWGKWLGAYATVPRLAILPIWVTTALVMVTGSWSHLVLLIGLIFAPAAVITSLGLALATLIPRTGRAVAVSVLAYVMMTAGWSTLLIVLSPPWRPAAVSNRVDPGGVLQLLNPYYGVSRVTQAAGASGLWSGWMYSWIDVDFIWALLTIGIHLAIAAVWLTATLLSFDRCVGRVPERRFLPRWDRSTRPANAQSP